MLTTLLLLLALQDASAPPKAAPAQPCPAGLSGLACAADNPQLGSSSAPPCVVSLDGQLLYPAYATPIPHTEIDIWNEDDYSRSPIQLYSDSYGKFHVALGATVVGLVEYVVVMNAEGMEILRQKLFVPRECRPGPGINVDIPLHSSIKPAEGADEDTVAVESLARKIPDQTIKAFAQSMDRKAKASPQETEAALQQVINTVPDYYGATLELGLEYKKGNQQADAIRTLTHALEINSGSTLARATLGEYAFNTGNFQAAADLLSQAARLGSISPDVYYMLGISYYKLGQLAAAEASLRRALSIAPSIGKAYLQLYNVYMKAKMPDKALQAAETYLQKYPNTGDREYVQSMTDKLRKSLKP